MIDYASRQRTPRKHIVGLTVVVVLHGLLFWAINSGLARKFVKVIKGPVEAVLLEETKPDIPPPPPPPPPPKNLPPPPPAYVPCGCTHTGQRHCGGVQHASACGAALAFACANSAASAARGHGRCHQCL
ncbi:MAG: hypothetical protein RI896_174 [Pseudomonadota bacterium]